MPLEATDLKALYSPDVDDIIDVRSPAEFAEDHIPGAINLPALNDRERAEVGEIYVQDSPFRARKIGAAMVETSRVPRNRRRSRLRELPAWRGE